MQYIERNPSACIQELYKIKTKQEHVKVAVFKFTSTPSEMYSRKWKKNDHQRRDRTSAEVEKGTEQI